MIAAADAAHASLKDAVSALRSTKGKVGPILKDLRRLLVMMYRGDTGLLTDFGIAAPKAPKPRTGEQNAAAAAKAAATREARGTKSPKEKRAIKGNVTGVSVTPITAPAAAAPSAQPVPAT